MRPPLVHSRSGARVHHSRHLPRHSPPRRRRPGLPVHRAARRRARGRRPLLERRRQRALRVDSRSRSRSCSRSRVCIRFSRLFRACMLECPCVYINQLVRTSIVPDLISSIVRPWEVMCLHAIFPSLFSRIDDPGFELRVCFQCTSVLAYSQLSCILTHVNSIVSRRLCATIGRVCGACVLAAVFPRTVAPLLPQSPILFAASSVLLCQYVPGF